MKIQVQTIQDKEKRLKEEKKVLQILHLPVPIPPRNQVLVIPILKMFRNHQKAQKRNGHAEPGQILKVDLKLAVL